MEDSGDSDLKCRGEFSLYKYSVLTLARDRCRKLRIIPAWIDTNMTGASPGRRKVSLMLTSLYELNIKIPFRC